MVTIYFNVVDDHLDGWSSTPEGYEYECAVSDDHEVLLIPEIFKFENGDLIKDEEYQQQLIDEESSRQNQPSDDEINAIAIMELTEMLMGGGE